MNESTVRELLLRQMGELQYEEKIITDMEPVQAPAVTLSTPVLRSEEHTSELQSP